ncbi:MAG: hypothetical protein Tsb0013_16970 [Phycisphaerales bacterium]
MARHHSLIGLTILALLGGCRSGAPAEGRAYPPGPSAETLDIQVEREETVLRLTNTSARSFGPSTLWVNAGFSHPIDGFGIGETLVLDLGSFVDEYGNRFRAGGFFATRQPHDLVLAELEDGADGTRYGLIVTRGEAP